MLREAGKLLKDFGTPNPAIYWADLLASALIGYGALGSAILLDEPSVKAAAGVVAMLALYRAGSFIHELTHIRPDTVPGFRTVWNLLIGIPLMMPSFLYEGVHTLHHARPRYGTADDPEYLPLALMRPRMLLLFLAAAALAPVAMIVRFAILFPLSLISPRLRSLIVARYSALSINPGFRRVAPTGRFRASWFRLEAAASLWAIVLLGLVATGIFPLGGFLIFLAVLSGATTLNQVRTLVAHRWENEGDPLSLTEQYLDSVNVPPPALLPALWAPVGLRYHALHHLLPAMPYHALGQAHRRLLQLLPHDSVYSRANYGSLRSLLVDIVRASFSSGAGKPDRHAAPFPMPGEHNDGDTDAHPALRAAATARPRPVPLEPEPIG